MLYQMTIGAYVFFAKRVEDSKEFRPLSKWLPKVFLFFMVVIAIASRSRILEFVGNILIRIDIGNLTPDSKPTFIALLMGDQSSTRADEALRLYSHFKNGRIVMVQEQPSAFIKLGLQRPNALVHRDYLIAKGVKPDHIIFLSDCVASSTVEEAHCLSSYFGNSAIPPASVILVTSWYHTSRAGWLFDKEAKGQQWIVAPAFSSTSNPTSWWLFEESFLAVFEEYLKWVYWVGIKTVKDICDQPRNETAL